MADLPAVRSFINLIDSGVKTCSINLIVYRMLYLCISAPLYEADMHKYNTLYTFKIN
jgi:hypothetical protein